MEAHGFRELQAQLPDLLLHDDDGNDLLVLPSLSFEPRELALVPGAHHYEERQLFELVRLRHPRNRVIYVTSKLLPDLVVDMVLELLPGVPTSHARQRLRLFDTDDASLRPLTAKLLERPRLLQRIRAELRPGRSLMTCFLVGPLERQLSERLQLPLLGSDPSLAHWGSKAGSRELFERCGLPHPRGSDLRHDLDGLAEAAAALWESCGGLSEVVVKLNEGFSGEGNARLALAPLDLGALDGQGRRQRLRQALETLPMPAADWKHELLPRQGALVEEWLAAADEVCSPSVQGMIHADGRVEILSTHEQVLGGSDGQTYQGCRCPARADYRLQLQQWGLRLGQELARLGALERFALDTVARRRGGHWDLQAIEVNLRKGGTTHPQMALRFLSQGTLDWESGRFLSPRGNELCYEATDTFSDPVLRGLLPLDLVDTVVGADLHYDALQERGSVFHLLGCLSEYGKLGFTCIGGSAAEAAALYRRTGETLLAAGRAAGHR
ncbi:MAG: peptide ligase PGM1-related protein [Prochlorococcaceae cyanobacterium]